MVIKPKSDVKNEITDESISSAASGSFFIQEETNLQNARKNNNNIERKKNQSNIQPVIISPKNYDKLGEKLTPSKFLDKEGTIR